MNVLFKSGLYGSFLNKFKTKSLLNTKIIAFFVGSYGSKTDYLASSKRLNIK